KWPAMKSQKFELTKIADALREHCPFIVFATLPGIDEDGQVTCLEIMEVCVFIGSDTGIWDALEQILPAIAKVVKTDLCHVTFLNRVDVETRYRAVNGVCLFIREGKEHNYRQFARHAILDYRIMRAQQRRRGLIEND
ncbi:MAG: hypothetical protein NTW16_09570, partial [Bacteroidetes bacterium]|nr:hypothetical protein [Bacteroidota bacterium]